MDQSSSRAAGLSCPDRRGTAEEGAASATRVKSGPRSWELEDMRGTCGETRIHPGRFQGAEQKLSVTFRRPRSNFLTNGSSRRRICGAFVNPASRIDVSCAGDRKPGYL